MINIFQPNVSEDSLKLLKDVFDSKWLGRGEYVDRFEARLSSFLKIERIHLHTIASCTDALFGVFDIFNFSYNDEVIIPSISFPAIASSIVSHGLKPVIVDVDVETGNIKIDTILENITPKTVAIFVTDYGGNPVDINLIRAIVGPNILIFEDAACAFGTFIDGKACGVDADFTSWSFDAMKLLTCGEGGAFYIKDASKMEKAKQFFYLGLPSQGSSGVDRQGISSNWWEYQIHCLGRRSVFTNINAAVGLPQFDNIDQAIQIRKKIRKRFCDQLDTLGCRYLIQERSNVEYSNYFFTIVTEKRDALAQFLKAQGVYTTFRYYPIHKIGFFEQYARLCPGADFLSNYALNIPIHHSLTESDIDFICESLKLFFTQKSDRYA